MIRVDYAYIFDDGHSDEVTVTIPISYARLLLLLDPFEIIWEGGEPTDGETGELEAGVAAVTGELNGT